MREHTWTINKIRKIIHTYHEKFCKEIEAIRKQETNKQTNPPAEDHND